jgi:hypothetical protein
VQVLAASTAYTKRNVQEAVTSLTGAGVLFAFEVGNEQRFSIPLDRWAHRCKQPSRNEQKRRRRYFSLRGVSSLPFWVCRPFTSRPSLASNS